MNSYTLEFIKTIPGNVNRISDLHWGHDDLYLYSASEDGNLCIWNSMTLQEEYHKATECTYRGVVANRDRDVYLSGYEKNGEVIDYFLRERDESNKISTFNVLNEKVTNICLLETFLGHSALLCGTESGEIKIYTEALEKGPYDEIKTHLGRVNRIIASPNGRYVFSVGDDGLLNIYQVTNIKNGIEI
jgi:WD40 repeat protein